MSVDVTSPAWKTKLGNPTAKSVLNILADATNSDGFGFPSWSYMADQTELSERQVMRIIQCFQMIGLVKKLPGMEGRYKYSFQINLAMLRRDLTREFAEAFRRAQGKATVSQTVTATVSQTANTVSQTAITVCETVPPHPLLGGTVTEPSENRNTPLPPASGGSVARSLPFAVNEPDEVQKLELATSGVMDGCGWTRRRLRMQVKAQLRLKTRGGECCDAAAARMIARWREQTEQWNAGNLLRPHGPDKFVGDGIWDDLDRWLWDIEKLERRSAATVGMYRPTG